MITVEVLVAYARELDADADRTTDGVGLQWLKDRRTEALKKIAGGGSSDYIVSSGNGKSFTRQIQATALEWFEATTQAIADYNATRTKVIYPTHSGIPY